MVIYGIVDLTASGTLVKRNPAIATLAVVSRAATITVTERTGDITCQQSATP